MRYVRPTFIGLLALAALLALFSQGQPAYAATFTVTKTADTNDGVCDGDCSLREAIGAANALAGADAIIVPAGTYTLSIAGTSEDANATGDLDITGDVTITGAGAATTIVNGGGINRVLDILGAGVTADISSVTIQNGFANPGGGGGISNRGDATLTNVTVSGNEATGGGGISNLGTLTLDNSTVSGNTAVSGGGGGGGIRNLGDATLTNVTVSGNTAGLSGGGGIGNFGDATLTNVTVSGNAASGQGGGIHNNFGTVTVNSSTVSGNTAVSGGGILNTGTPGTPGTVTLISSTVSDNSATFFGGGIFNNRGATTLTNSTVRGNTASQGGGILNNVGTVTLKNTIVANSTAGGDCSGTITTLGNNLDSDGTCGLVGPDDLPNTNPLLGPLALNPPGSTATHALLPGSLAIDAGSGDCPPPATDQRGVVRPQGAACDIGAFELEPLVVTVDMDIKPGSDPNSTNLGSMGVIPVAILTTPAFDATTVDPATVDFEGASPVHDAPHDVDDDGDLDLIMHFRTQETNIADDATEGCLTGETTSGQPIEGCDAVRIVPPNMDSDGDGFGDAVEATLGTDQFVACPTDASHDAWPPDKDGNTTVGIDDVFFAGGRFNAGAGDPDYISRAEITSQNGVIGVDDIFGFAVRFGQSC